jgi:hypothetical protein
VTYPEDETHFTNQQVQTWARQRWPERWHFSRPLIQVWHTYQLEEHHVCLLLIWVIWVGLLLAAKVIIRGHNDRTLKHLQKVLWFIVHRHGGTKIDLVHCVRDFNRTQVILTVGGLARLRLIYGFKRWLYVMILVNFSILLHEIVLCAIFTNETCGGHLTCSSGCLSLKLAVHHIPKLRVEHHFKRRVPLDQCLILASPQEYSNFLLLDAHDKVWLCWWENTHLQRVQILFKFPPN